jgi:hypothetical protein
MKLLKIIPLKLSHGSILFLLCVGLGIFQPESAMAQTITVKQDGTGDFTVIQDAVDVAINGDTVLVFPGIYFENVDMTGKGIVLASTWIFSNNDSLISQTVIDGNQQGSCIRSLSGSNLAEIIGITLQQGRGYKDPQTIFPNAYGSGGGIYFEHSKAKIINCIVMNNFGFTGGGIQSIFSDLELIGNKIFNNWAARNGGGISSAYSKIIYDSILLNNVYLNYSSSGSDIAFFSNDTIDKIWLDTCTVLNPDQYYIGKFDDHLVHIDRPPMSILHGKIEQVNADLYVNPSGDDANSGLSPDDPLKTISFALLKIASDSTNIKSVHVADGVYSNSLTGEHVPIQLKNYVNLIGQSRDNTIIDCENKYEGARFAFGQDFSLVRNISFYNGNGYPTIRDGGISTGYSKKLVLDSIGLINTTGDMTVGIYSDSDDTLIMSNSKVYNCAGYKGLEIGINIGRPPRYVEFISDQFSWDHPDTSWDTKQITLLFVGDMATPGQIYTKIINCLFDNNSDSVPLVPVPVGIAVSAIYQSFVSIVNCTFADNTTTNTIGGPFQLGRSHGELFNCIFYGNVPNQIVLANTPEEPSTLDVYNCLIQDGQAGVINFGGSNIVEWGEGNLDKDPLFLGSDEFPYAIDAGSPCIDAGTLDLPPWITLPEYDIAGNPRVWGESVDIGAYEYGPWVKVPPAPNSKFQIPNSKSLTVSPNPFSYGTYVSYELKDNARLNISVYSISGMKVKTLVNNIGSVGDKGSFYWDGRDQNGQALPAGVYFIRMTMDAKEVETVKVIRK